MKTPKVRALGNALRQAREERGLTLRELGQLIGREAGVLSRWETGNRTPSPGLVAEFVTALGVNGDQYDDIMALTRGTDDSQWLAITLPEQRLQLAALLDFEQTAAKILTVQPLLMPGLLQTASYVRAIMSVAAPTAEIATRVAVRLGRKDVLSRSNPAPIALDALIGEGALRQLIGTPAVMAEQLRYLLDMGQHDNVSMRVIGHETGWHPGLEGPFTLIEPAQQETIPAVHLENRRSGMFLHEPEDIGIYREAFQQVSAVAMTPKDSAKLITEYANRWENME